MPNSSEPTSPHQTAVADLSTASTRPACTNASRSACANRICAPTLKNTIRRYRRPPFYPLCPQPNRVIQSARRGARRGSRKLECEGCRWWPPQSSLRLLLVLMTGYRPGDERRRLPVRVAPRPRPTGVDTTRSPTRRRLSVSRDTMPPRGVTGAAGAWAYERAGEEQHHRAAPARHGRDLRQRIRYRFVTIWLVGKAPVLGAIRG